MPSPTDPPPLSAPAAFFFGMKTGLTSVFILVTFGTFLGVGALAHDLRFSLGWTVIAAVLVWAAPAQVITMTALATGGALAEIAVAVALSAVRLLPMGITLLPMLRGPLTRARHLILPAHFVTVTVWSEGLRHAPAIPRERRVTFINGMGCGFCSMAALSATGGFYLAGELPPMLAAALLFLTPLSFLLSTAINARSLVDRLALALGLVVAPLLVVYQVQLDLLWTGFIGGTLAYLVGRLRRPARKDVP